MMPTKKIEGPLFVSLIKLSLPIVFAQILQSAYQFTDAFWVGRLGDHAVAAVSVSFPMTFLLVALGAGFTVAGSTLIAQYFGAKNEDMVNHVTAQTLLASIVVALILSTIGYILTPTILHWMGVESAVFDGAKGFMRVSFIGLVFSFGFMMFQSAFRGIGQVMMPMYIVGGTVLLNFILDPLFIFGYGPISATGVMGAALATLGTQSLATIIGFVILLDGKHGIHLHLHDFRPDWQFIRRAFFLGLPSSIEMSGRALGMTVLTFLIAGFGTQAIAAYGVGSTVFQFVIIFCMGLSMAIGILVGQNIGAKEIEKAEKIAKMGAWLSFAIMMGVGIITWIFARQFVAFFIPSDQAVIGLGVDFIRAIALTYGLIGVQFAIIGAFRAAGNMVTTMVLTLISQWVLQIPLAYGFAYLWGRGLEGVWLAFPVTNILTTIITIAWFMRGTWKYKKITHDTKIVEELSEEAIREEGIHN